MTIWILYISAVIFATMILAACLAPAIRLTFELVESKHRTRHAKKRRNRARGYLPIHDEEWKP